MLFTVACGLLLLSKVHGLSFSEAPDISWSQPVQATLHDTGGLTALEAERPYDCTWLTYRMRGDLSKTMHSGCFIPAAFGMVEPDQAIVIAAGTDEAEELRYGGQPAALSILPYAGSVGRFGGFPGLGSYLYLYTNFPSNLEERGTPLHPYKEVTDLPNFVVRDSDGAALPINPLAFAYAARSQWLVTESPAHALIRINLANYSITPFDYSFYQAGRPYAEHRASLAITEDGRYVAVASAEFRTLKIYDLKHCSAQPTAEEPQLQQCKSYNYWPQIEGAISGLQNITQLNFVQDGLLSITTAQTGGIFKKYLLSPDGRASSLIPFLGIGDSYASGQGAFNYLASTDTVSNHCHLSARSYPLLLSGDHYSSAGKSVACSGAHIRDVIDISGGYKGQASSNGQSSAATLQNFTPGILAQQAFVEEYLPGVVTVEIGGNDVGFGDLLLRCISPVASIRPLALNPNNCYTSYEDRLELEQSIDRTYSRWLQAYQNLRKASPQTRIYAIGYPNIVSSQAKCRLNTPFTKDDIAFALDATSYLNGVIKKAASAAGVHYVDISQALAGHELCSGSSGELAMNGLTAGTDTYHILGQESFHPNAFGHQLIEQAILTATHNFADSVRPNANSLAPAPEANDSDPLLQAPRSGRPISRIVPVTNMVTSAARGGSMQIAITANDSPFMPNSTVSVIIGGVTVSSLPTNDHGAVNGTVPLPSNTPTGPQPVIVQGSSNENQPTSTTEVTYIQDSTNDYDGDGIPNTIDPCRITVACDTENNSNTPDIPRLSTPTDRIEVAKNNAAPPARHTSSPTQSAQQQKTLAASLPNRVAAMHHGSHTYRGNLLHIWWWLWVVLIVIIGLAKIVVTLAQKNGRRPR